MADVTIGTISLPVTAGVSIATVTYGATVTAGQSVYKDTSDSNEYKPADADVEASAVCAGIALVGGADGEAGVILTKGSIDLGATLTVGEIYVVSTTAGGIAPIGDLGSGDYVSIIGTASATGQLDLGISNTGVAKA